MGTSRNRRRVTSSSIEVFFATNRSYDRDVAEPTEFGNRFHPDGAQFFRVGQAKVAAYSDDTYEVREVHTQPEQGATDEDVDTELRGSDFLLPEIQHHAARDRRDVLIFIHGYAGTFEESLQRAAQLKKEYLVAPNGRGAGKEPMMFLFSWPANGRMVPFLSYRSDRQDAEQSGIAMARALMRLLDFLESQPEPCEQRIHLVAHSMGNWALRHAIQGMRHLLVGSRLPKVFDQVFLMAADEDEDALEHVHKLALLTQLARTIHVYHSVDDRALTISDTTKNNPDRLGAAGPRTFSGLSTRITAVDCSRVDKTTIAHANHQYYRLRKEVIRDVRAVLSGETMLDAIPGRQVVEPGRRYRIAGA